ncbi:hypothetical protein E4U53_001025 [Claviceps sorghi]|nr:hypothetical protein E4U53_001025 [Claviceps sorghi]
MPIRDWLKRPASAAAAIDTSGWDEYPVHLMDGSKLNHKVVGWTLRFDDVLDADMLHSALTRLLGMGHWRKLGGRLRRDAHNRDRLKILVPTDFSSSLPAVEYQHTVFPQTISSHPVGAHFPRPTETPTAQPLPKELGGLMAPDGYPDTVDGLVQSGKAQLALAVSSFVDATLVSLAFPQTLLDASGLVGLVQNWSLVLAGRQDQVAPLLNTQHDVLDDVTRDNHAIAPQECRMEKMRLTGFSYLKLMGRHVAEAAQRKRRLQALYIPRDAYQRLLVRLGQDDQDDQDDQDADADAGSRTRRIDDVHLLTAWLVDVMAAQESAPRPLTLVTLYDLRSCIQKLKDMCAGESAGPISQILTSSYCAAFPANALRAGGGGGTSVADLARSYAEQTAALTGEDEAVAHCKAMRRDLCAEKPGFALYGASDALVVFCQSLAGLHLVSMADFAPAVVTKPAGGHGEEERARTRTRTTPAGRIVSSVFNVVNWTDAGVDAVSLLGEDHGGGCWVMAKLSTGSWDSVLEELRGL